MLLVPLSPSYPREFSKLHSSYPWYWNSLLYGLISYEENFVHFLQLMPFTIFVPPGTYHCLVGRWRKKREVYPKLLHMTSSGNRTIDLLILSPQGSVLGCPKPVLGRTVPKTRFKPAFYCPKLSKTAQNRPKLSKTANWLRKYQIYTWTDIKFAKFKLSHAWKC